MLIDVLAIGELLADFISTDYVASLSEARQFHCFQGGSTANLCANLNWLGKNSRLVASVGNDGIGQQMLDTLKAAGLHTEYIQRSSEWPTSLVLVGRSKATPEFIAYRHADCQIPEVPQDWITSTRLVHTTAFALSRSPAREHILTALSEAARLGKQISCDWNFAPQIWGIDDGMQVFNALATQGALLKISMDDYERFCGRSNAQVEDAMAFLNPFPFSTCCLTAGAEGIWWKEENSPWKHHAAHPVSHVIDTTGAGDAFWAGFLNQLLEDQATEQAVLAGAMLAAQKIGQMGPLYSQKNNPIGF